MTQGNEVDSINHSAQATRLAAIVDEYSSRITRGENPNISELASRLPGSEEIVREVLQSLQLMGQFRAECSHDTQAVPKALGEYQILEEIGRGGMGVVFRARQTSLDRIVALKILPLVASVDKKRLERFQIEMRSASILQHPNIVAIHGTGCDQGVHYYAMQHIDGHSLEAYLTEARCTMLKTTERFAESTCSQVHADPHAGIQFSKFATATNSDAADLPLHVESKCALSVPLSSRDAAQLVRDVALALQHAHEFGVVHRDIKPSNLLIDRHGRVLVTDFGLAQIENQGTLTLTGDLVGTLRYMSPEQVLGTTPVDHRTDVYSLGATLFELLCLEPLIGGDDRAQILRSITSDEPRLSRRLNKRIPRDLETILLKATAKDRDARYASAAAFAEDLQRFLENRPITARRPGLGKVLAKTARRNPVLATAICVAPFLVLIGLAISNLAISEQKKRAEDALLVAQTNENQAKLEAQKARAVSSILQQMVASANPDQTKGSSYTVRQLLDDLSEGLFIQLADQPEIAVDLRSTIGNAYRRLGAPERAELHLRSALEFNLRHDRQPESIAGNYTDLAWNCAAMGDYATAADFARRALGIHEQLSLANRDAVQTRWCLQHCLIYQEKYAEADATAEAAIKMARSLGELPPELANITHDLAQSMTRQGRAGEASKLAKEAIALHRQLHGDSHPETGWGFDALGRAYQAEKKYAEAEEAYRSALAIFEANYPAEHKSVRMTLQLLEGVLKSAGKPIESEKIHGQRFSNFFSRFLTTADNSETSVIDYLMENRNYLAAGELVMAMPEAFDTSSKAIYAFNILSSYRSEIEKRFGSDHDEAAQAKWLKTCVELLTLAADQCPDDGPLLNNVAWNLVATVDARLHQPDKAVHLAERATQIEPLQGAYWNTLGLTLIRAGRFEDALLAIHRSQSFPTTDEYDLVLLSIASAALGKLEEASEQLESAKEMYAKRKTENQELERFLAEADVLANSHPK